MVRMITVFDEDGQIIEEETIDIPDEKGHETPSRDERIQRYKNAREAARQGNLSMSKLKAWMDATDDVLSLVVQDIGETP